jgi:protein subunit release factor A
MTIPEEDLRIDIFRSGTQHAVVRLTHLPTGHVASSETETGTSTRTLKERALAQLAAALSADEQWDTDGGCPYGG